VTASEGGFLGLVLGQTGGFLALGCRDRAAPFIGPGLMPALRAVAGARARPAYRTGPGTGTMAVLFRVVLRPARRARAIWPCITISYACFIEIRYPR
jgi:hypothetical protein